MTWRALVGRLSGRALVGGRISFKLGRRSALVGQNLFGEQQRRRILVQGHDRADDHVENTISTEGSGAAGMGGGSMTSAAEAVLPFTSTTSLVAGERSGAVVER